MDSKQKQYLLEAVARGYHFNKNDNLVTKNEKVVAGYIGHTGYPTISLSVGEKTGHVPFHRLKAYFIFGDAMFLPGIQVRHLNGNPRDWSNTNIALGTQHENIMDRTPASRTSHATRAASYIKKVTKAQREEIRNLYKNNNMTMPEIARLYGLKSKGTVCMIIHKTGHYKIDKTPEELMS